MHMNEIRDFDLDAFLVAHPNLAANERVVSARLREHLAHPHPRISEGSPACRTCCGAIAVLLASS